MSPGQLFRRLALPAVVTIAFAAAIVLNPAFSPMLLWDSLKAASYGWIPPAAAVFLVGVWLRAARWRILLRGVGDVPFSACLQSMLIGLMANNVLPFRLGELVRAQELHTRAGVSRAASLASVLAERMLDVMALVLLFAAGALLHPLPGIDAGLMRGAGLALAAGSAALVVGIALGPALAAAAVRVALRVRVPLVERAASIGVHALAGFAAVRSPRALVQMVGLSLAAWALEAVAILMVIAAFSGPAEPAVAAMVTAAATLATSLPSTQGGIGPFEFAAAQVLVAAGMEASAAAALAIAAHATVLLPVIPPGVWLLWRGRRAALTGRQAGA